MEDTSPDLSGSWHERVRSLRKCFTAPGWLLFDALMTAWALCPGRKTITGILRFVEEDLGRAHDAYHRLVRAAAWDMVTLWETLACVLVAALVPYGTIRIDMDDTLFHKSGRKVDGAAWWHDAVRSTSARPISALGLNLLVVTVRITLPWGGPPIGLPILVLLHRKNGEKLTALARRALSTVATWFPDRQILCCADGAYASTLIPQASQRITVISRLRCDAALYDIQPDHTGKRGRPRKRGARLGTPKQLAATARRWDLVHTDERGRLRDRLVYVREVLWYSVKQAPVLLVISRDPDQHQHDDFWVCSAVTMPPHEVISGYAGRWSIEETFRATKQTIGAHQPQSWARGAPERAACLGFLLYSLVWWWFLSLDSSQHKIDASPWYSDKSRPSFLDAIVALRIALWHNRISRCSDPAVLDSKITETLIRALAHAA